MNRPPRFDLVQSFDALALAGTKTPNVDKELPKLPGPDDVEPTVAHPRPLPPPTPVPPPKHITMPVPVPAPKQSLTMRYALEFFRRNAPTKPAPPPVTVPSTVSPKPSSKPSLSAVTITQPTFVTPSKPRAVSVPHSFPTSSPARNTARCSGMTRAGRQCLRQVRLPATHSHLDPTPALYCYQHKEAMISGQPGVYVRTVGNADRFVEFSHYIPEYLQMDTQLALRVEMEKAISPSDVAGYIYTFEIRDPKRPDVIQLKVGRAVNLNKRLDQWDKQCGSKVQIPRGWWPGTVEGDDGSLLKGNIKAGDPGPFCHRVERLVHIELADLSLHTPYLNLSWPDGTLNTSTTHSPKKALVKEMTCLDCGVVHKEIFTFPRPERGRYKGKEWDLIVKPVIERWGRFVKEYYT